MSLLRNPGTYLLVGVIQFGLLMQIAEFLYSGYSVSANYISDLGVGPEPGRTIFNGSAIVLGLLGSLAAMIIWRDLKPRGVAILLLISGLGTIGVGIFTEETGAIHTVTSLVAFMPVALAAIWSFKVTKGVFRFASVVLGVWALVALIMLGSNTLLGLGVGGVERMVFYPDLFWTLGFGALLSHEAIAKR